MSFDPLFSIAIPTYNRRELLKTAITSALNQTYANIEIVVLNNASTDGTTDWLMSLNADGHKLKIINRKNNIGAISNIKDIINHISGKYLVVLSDDDSLEPEFATEAVNDLEGNADATIWYCKCNTIFLDDSSLNRATRSSPHIENGIRFAEDYLRINRDVWWVATVYKTKILRDIGGFVGNGILIDVISRTLCAIKGKVLFHDKILANYLLYNNNASNSYPLAQWSEGWIEMYEFLIRELGATIKPFCAYHASRFIEGAFRKKAYQIKDLTICFKKFYSIFSFQFLRYTILRWPFFLFRFFPSNFCKNMHILIWKYRIKTTKNGNL
jgi:glycosyltransferase involved in cell wall biosynthesis